MLMYVSVHAGGKKDIGTTQKERYRKGGERGERWRKGGGRGA
jgi:hypothetical protein